MVRRNAVWNSRLYRLLLNLYPADFRETYGDAMVCVFEETLANAYAQAGKTASSQRGLLSWRIFFPRRWPNGLRISQRVSQSNAKAPWALRSEFTL
jgi:hypothetical protein